MISVIKVTEKYAEAEFSGGSVIRIGIDMLDGRVGENDILVMSDGRFRTDHETTEQIKKENRRKAVETVTNP